jgi:hypothetical protein
MAWAGAVAGLNDELRSNAAELGYTTDLKQIVREVVQRLDAEYGASLAEVLREPMGSQAAKAPR